MLSRDCWLQGLPACGISCDGFWAWTRKLWPTDVCSSSDRWLLKRDLWNFSIHSSSWTAGVCAWRVAWNSVCIISMVFLAAERAASQNNLFSTFCDLWPSRLVRTRPIRLKHNGAPPVLDRKESLKSATSHVCCWLSTSVQTSRLMDATCLLAFTSARCGRWFPSCLDTRRCLVLLVQMCLRLSWEKFFKKKPTLCRNVEVLLNMLTGGHKHFCFVPFCFLVFFVLFLFVALSTAVSIFTLDFFSCLIIR